MTEREKALYEKARADVRELMAEDYLTDEEFFLALEELVGDVQIKRQALRRRRI